MKCRKLSTEDRAEWNRTLFCGYENSPYQDRLSRSAFDVLVQVCAAAAAENFEVMLQAVDAGSEEIYNNEERPSFHTPLMRAYEHAVACGNAPACMLLANLRLVALEDTEGALELFELGATRGHGQSWVELGDAHYYGRGTGVDPQRAYYCYQQAANLSGNAEALEKMAFMRSLGLVGEEAISNQS